ncbi:FecR domain-containing protein [Bordetella muralis]|jgi:transmembrane sensor|uniref:FecR domain-containing protein n=1 Tax=Bordetella muralis TaxID=1649130 RepID=UPI0039EF7231
MSARELVTPAEAPLDRGVAREAARWLMRLGSGHATAADVRACDRWRADNTEHERAWQRAQALSRTFGLIPAEVGMATLDRPAAKSRRAALKTLVALLVASPVAWSTWNAAPVVRWRADHRTAVGERREILLADGSRVWLNTATAIDEAFTDTDHALWLRDGEIYVQASPQRSPALRIETRMGAIHADAAAHFAVRLDAQRCLVNVTTGQVEVSPARAATHRVRLNAAQQAAFDADTVYSRQTSDTRDPDWLRGTLHADAMRLDVFAAELARYRSGIIRCDPAVAALRISGTFQLSNTDAVLQALPALLPVQVNYRTSYWVTLGPAATQA